VSEEDFERREVYEVGGPLCCWLKRTSRIYVTCASKAKRGGDKAKST
jgi:hypothetical protein